MTDTGTTLIERLRYLAKHPHAHRFWTITEIAEAAVEALATPTKPDEDRMREREWREIETAPKDGTNIWLGHECGFMAPGFFMKRVGRAGHWQHLYENRPIVWTPRLWQALPAAPVLANTSEAP